MVSGLMIALLATMSTACTAEQKATASSEAGALDRQEVYRRFVVAVADRLDHGWGGIATVGLSETSQRRIEQYNRASKGGPSPFPLVFGDYLEGISEVSSEPGVQSYAKLQDLKSLVEQRGRDGKPTYALVLWSVGDDHAGPNYVSFSIFEARIDAKTGEVGRYGDFATLYCLVYGTGKSGYKLSLLSMAVS